MKTHPANFYRVQAGIILIVLAGLFSSASAQNYQHKLRHYQTRTNNYAILGAGIGVGTTTYKFKSDVKALNGLKVYGEGWSTEVIIGNKEYKFRAGFGNYHFDKSKGEAIHQTLFTSKLNISPKALLGMTKYVRFYIVTGVDYNVYEFKGIAIPQPQKKDGIKKPVTPKCDCTTPSERAASILGDGPSFLIPKIVVPEEVPEPTEEVHEEKEPIAQIKKAQINTGLGIEINILKGGYFLRLFGEAYYGFPLKEITYNLGLSKTQITPQLMINFGVGIGIGR